MVDTVLKVQLAALFYDVGKFAQGSLSLSQEYIIRNTDFYQPSRLLPIFEYLLREILR